MMPSLSVIGLLLAAIAGTCTSEVSTTTAPSTAPTTAPPPASSEPATATTATPTTTIPGATTTTTISPGAGAPVVTLVPLTPEEQEVVDALYEARTLAVEAAIDPDAGGLDARLNDAFAREGQQRSAVEADRQYLRNSGLRARVNDGDPWRLTVETVELIDDPYVRADVQVCYFDSNVLFEPGGAPDGSDAVVNDEVGSGRILYSLVVEDDRWQLLHGQRLTDFAVGARECPAA